MISTFNLESNYINTNNGTREKGGILERIGKELGGYEDMEVRWFQKRVDCQVEVVLMELRQGLRSKSKLRNGQPSTPSMRISA